MIPRCMVWRFRFAVIACNGVRKDGGGKHIEHSQ